MAPMSVASVPGFDVLFPSGTYSNTTSGSSSSSSTSATGGTSSSSTSAANTSSSTSSTGSTSSTSSTGSSTSTSSTSGSDSTSAASTAPSAYEQSLDSLESWEYQYLYENTFGASDSSGLYATAGLSVDQFANLAYELQNLGSSSSSTSSTGSTIDTSA
jgi:hypothetical protein